MHTGVDLTAATIQVSAQWRDDWLNALCDPYVHILCTLDIVILDIWEAKLGGTTLSAILNFNEYDLLLTYKDISNLWFCDVHWVY